MAALRGSDALEVRLEAVSGEPEWGIAARSCAGPAPCTTPSRQRSAAIASPTSENWLFRLLNVKRATMAEKGRPFERTIRAVGRVLRTRGADLVSLVGMMLALILVAATLMYQAEHEAQPEAFSSIPAAAWWAVTTLTTVGYGDIYPVTPVGKLIASVIAVLGIAAFALPTGLLASALNAELARSRVPADRVPADGCPTCGAVRHGGGG